VRLHCRLREFRGGRTLREISDASGVGQPDLSRIERGQQLPADDWLLALEDAYGSPRHEWWPREVLVLLQRDDEVPA
jgi:transcriptional regulator with XRE-family HTH domain